MTAKKALWWGLYGFDPRSMTSHGVAAYHDVDPCERACQVREFYNERVPQFLWFFAPMSRTEIQELGLDF